MVATRVGVVVGQAAAGQSESLQTQQAILDALQQQGHEAVPVAIDEFTPAVIPQQRSALDVVFFALPGVPGDLQKRCDLYEIPYTGSSGLATALAANRRETNELLRLHNVPTPTIHVTSSTDETNVWLEAYGGFGFPLVVKPQTHGVNHNTVVVSDKASLRLAVANGLKDNPAVLLERFMAGRIVRVGLLDGHVLGAVECEENGQVRGPVQSTSTRLRGVTNLAKRAADALGCRGALLVNVLLTDQANEYVLDITTHPELLASSPFGQIANAVGLPFDELCSRILATAQLHSRKPVKDTSALRSVRPSLSWQQVAG